MCEVKRIKQPNLKSKINLKGTVFTKKKMTDIFSSVQLIYSEWSCQWASTELSGKSMLDVIEVREVC